MPLVKVLLDTFQPLASFFVNAADNELGLTTSFSGFSSVDIILHFGMSLGWRQDFRMARLNLPTGRLKYSFKGTINAENLRKNGFLFPKGG